MAAGTAYWDGVAGQVDALPAAFRRQARREHVDLVRRWVGEPRGRWLKTDLFEERSDDRALLAAFGQADWVGMDVSPEVAVQATARAATVAAADVRRLPFAGRSFDGVLSTSTLDHFDDVADIGRSLLELARVLRPGGHLVLTLDNPANPLIRLRNALPRPLAARTGLVPFAVGATLDRTRGEAALRKAGFHVLASAHLLHVPHVLGTRPARWVWYERRVLPRFAVLADTRVAARTGHYVAFLATPTEP